MEARLLSYRMFRNDSLDGILYMNKFALQSCGKMAVRVDAAVCCINQPHHQRAAKLLCTNCTDAGFLMSVLLH